MSAVPAIPYAEVIGDPIAQSKSPAIHRFWLDALGIAGDYRAQHVRGHELGDYFAARRADPAWRGCNVTIPHKIEVMAHLDGTDARAEAVGAVNCVRRDGDRLVGSNSDVVGFLEPLAPLLARRHLFRMARIFGAGGAARAVAHGLKCKGFTLVIAARDVRAAEALRDAVDPGGYAVALDHFAAPLEFAWDDRAHLLDLVVNTTSLGMAGNPPLRLDFSHVPPNAIVYDAVYAPLETPLLAEAKRHGLRTIDGLAMLIGQAREAFRLFFGAEPPAARDDELRARLVA